MIECLNRHNITGWVHHMQFSLYQLDFAFPEYKLCVEIDGPTHLLPKIIEKDRIRDEYLLANGWRTLRITAKDFKNNPYDAINKILNELGEKQIEIPQEFLNKKLVIHKKNELKEKANRERIENKLKEREILYNKRREIILQNNDYSNGWIVRLARKLNVTDNGFKRFIKHHMSDYYLLHFGNKI